MSQALSYILPEEEQEAIELVAKSIGFEIPRVCGYFVLIKLHLNTVDGKIKDFIDHQGNQKSLYCPDSTIKNEKYSSQTGLVIGMGAEAYNGDSFERTGPWCKVGDFVLVNKTDCKQINYRGTELVLVPDNRIMMILQDPSHVSFNR